MTHNPRPACGHFRGPLVRRVCFSRHGRGPRASGQGSRSSRRPPLWHRGKNRLSRNSLFKAFHRRGHVSAFTGNPEFLRYARSQLRPTKLLSTALISLALSLTIGFVAFYNVWDSAEGRRGAANSLLDTAFILQALVLAIGGGIACFNSIYSE